MSQLVLAVAAIAIWAALAATGAFWFGSAFSSGKAKGDALEVVSAASQVAAAAAMHRRDNDGELPSSLTALVSDGHLRDLPEAPEVTTRTSSRHYELMSTPSGGVVLANTFWGAPGLCASLNRLAGTTPTSVASSRALKMPYGCVDTPTSATNGTADTGDYLFFHRL